MWLSLKRFYRERSWQKRFDACGDVVTSLHNLVRREDVWWEQEFLQKEFPDDYLNEVSRQGEDGWRTLRRYADLGPLALPDEVSEEVKRFVIEYAKVSDLRDGTELQDAIEQCRAVSQTALRTIPSLAATALSITPRRTTPLKLPFFS